MTPSTDAITYPTRLLTEVIPLLNEAAPRDCNTPELRAKLLSVILGNPRYNPNRVYGLKGTTPLMAQIESPDPDSVSKLKLILRAGASVMMRARHSMWEAPIPPLAAACFSSHAQVRTAKVELLLKARNGPNAIGARVDGEGSTSALEIVCFNGDFTYLQWFLEHKDRFDINQTFTMSPDTETIGATWAAKGVTMVKLPPSEYTVLHQSSGRGHLSIVRLLLENGADVNVGIDPVAPASFGGHIDIVRLLLAHNAPLDSFSPTQKGLATPLHLAARKGHVGVARCLLEHGANPAGLFVGHLRGDSLLWETSLLIACVSGRVEMIRLLLEFGANVNHGVRSTKTQSKSCGKDCRQQHGVTPLFKMCGLSKRDDDAEAMVNGVIVILLEAGANANQARPCDGMTPLYAACMRARVQAVTALLARGANPNGSTYPDTCSVSPLAVACGRGEVDIVRALLVYGADPNIRRTHDGYTPLHSLYTILDPEGDAGVTIASLLILYGADRNAVSHRGDTPLELWSSVVAPDAMITFMTATASWSPLEVAAARGMHGDIAAALAIGAVAPRRAIAWRPEIVRMACPETRRMMGAALRPWSPARHMLYPGPYRAAVTTLLLVAQRFECARQSMRLPKELWLLVASVLCRTDWPARPLLCSMSIHYLQQYASRTLVPRPRGRVRKSDWIMAILDHELAHARRFI